MKDYLFRKGLVFSLIILLLGVSVGSIVNAQVSQTIFNKRNELNTLDDDQVEIKIYPCGGYSGLEKEVIMISQDEAIQLKNRIENVRNSDKSFMEMYAEQLEILKDAGVISVNITLESILEDANRIDDKRSYGGNVFAEDILIDSNCLIGFMGVGISFPYGTHSTAPTIGADAAVASVGLFYVMSLALGSDNAKFAGPGFLAGLCLGFVGYLIKMSVPGVYGLFILGIGYSLFTAWIPFL